MFPKIEGAIGLQWRKRANGSLIATWVCRQDLVKRGYTLKTQRVWAGLEDELNDESRAIIVQACRRLQDEMLTWARGGPLSQPLFDGSLKSLIDFYRRDIDSPYQKVRFVTRRSYNTYLDALENEVGSRQLSALRGKDFIRWYQAWSSRPATAHARITMLRMVLSFGIVLELYPHGTDHCARLKAILSELRFSQAPARNEILTAEHAIAIRKAAHELGFPSVALAQALQFELMLRQKDVIGEWVPMNEPGLSSVTSRGRKWLYGLNWSEVDANLILSHPMSKSRTGKILEFDLNSYPMVKEELALIPDSARIGPMIVSEFTGLPWISSKRFYRMWRKAAEAAGVPSHIQNRDSRAGGITEASDASGDNLDAVRHHAGHSDVRITQRYSRGGLHRRSNLAVLRVAARSKNKPST